MGVEGAEEADEVEDKDDEVEDRRSPGARRGEGVEKTKGNRDRFARGVTGGSTRCQDGKKFENPPQPS